MKKKGLIIATIVMVLVLAVSLTTATYAWFTTSASTKVDQIAVNIAAASAVNVGVTTTYNSQDSTQYMYDAINVSGATNNTLSYAEGTSGLGSSLSIPAFNLGTAVGTTTDSSAWGTTVDGTFNPTNTIFAAKVNTSAQGYSSSSAGTPDTSDSSIAKANIDYIDLRMGATAAKAGVQGIFATVKVKTTGTAKTLKMVAALHFYIKAGTTQTVEFDLFGNATNNTQINGTAMSGLTPPIANAVTYAVEDNQATATFSFFIAGAKAYSASGTDLYSATSPVIYPFEIYGYVWGPDSACISSATGCGCTIDIEFGAVNGETQVPNYFVVDATAGA